MEAAAPARKAVALVFCDIAGTMRLTAQVGDLVVATILREFLEQSGRLGTEHHCLVIKFLGDGFLTAFENVETVMPFVFSIQSLLSQNPMFIGRPLGFKFSVHYGNVLYIETSYGKDVVGQEVNVAARLNELARPDEMVISQVALERMPSTHAGPSESVQVKGVGDPVEFRRVDLSQR